MTKTAKKRLCWNCEGNVSLNAETCPFCGVSVVPATLDGSVHSFAPSYQPGKTSDMAIPISPYAAHEEKSTDEDPQSGAKENEGVESSADSFKQSLISTVLLLSGSVFLLFGLVLVLFSHRGVLTLQWDADNWLIFIVLSLPMLFFGWRYLKDEG